MNKFLRFMLYGVLILAVGALPVLMLFTMQDSGYFTTPTLPVSEKAILAEEKTPEPTVESLPVSVLVTADVLERREKPDTGRNLGYWVRGDEIQVLRVCSNLAGDVWFAFDLPVSGDTGWSAAKYQGRQFVKQIPSSLEKCDE